MAVYSGADPASAQADPAAFQVDRQPLLRPQIRRYRPQVPGYEPPYRATSLIRNRHPVGPYSRTMPRLLWWCEGGVAVSFERGTPVLRKLARLTGRSATPSAFSNIKFGPSVPGYEPPYKSARYKLTNPEPFCTGRWLQPDVTGTRKRVISQLP